MIFMFKSFVVTFYHLWIQLQPTCYTAFMVIVLTLVGKTVIAMKLKYIYCKEF